MTMLPPPTPEEFLLGTLLLAVRDGFDRLVFRKGESLSGEAFARAGSAWWELVPPENEQLDAFSAELARLEPPARWRDGLVAWPRRLRLGRFRLPVGAASVPVAYCVRWEAGRVAEVELFLAIAPELAEAAEEELQALSPPLPW
jgi:hypothetical protein